MNDEKNQNNITPIGESPSADAKEMREALKELINSPTDTFSASLLFSDVIGIDLTKGIEILKDLTDLKDLEIGNERYKEMKELFIMKTGLSNDDANKAFDNILSSFDEKIINNDLTNTIDTQLDNFLTEKIGAAKEAIKPEKNVVDKKNNNVYKLRR